MENIRNKSYFGYVAKAYPIGYDSSNIQICIPSLFPNLGVNESKYTSNVNSKIVKNIYPMGTTVNKTATISLPLTASSKKPDTISKGTKVKVTFMSSKITSGHITII